MRVGGGRWRAFIKQRTSVPCAVYREVLAPPAPSPHPHGQPGRDTFSCLSLGYGCWCLEEAGPACDSSALVRLPMGLPFLQDEDPKYNTPKHEVVFRAVSLRGRLKHRKGNRIHHFACPPASPPLTSETSRGTPGQRVTEEEALAS